MNKEAVINMLLDTRMRSVRFEDIENLADLSEYLDCMIPDDIAAIGWNYKYYPILSKHDLLRIYREGCDIKIFVTRDEDGEYNLY